MWLCCLRLLACGHNSAGQVVQKDQAGTRMTLFFIRLRSAPRDRVEQVVAQFVPQVLVQDVFSHRGKLFRADSVRHKDDTCAWAAATSLAGRVTAWLDSGWLRLRPHGFTWSSLGGARWRSR